MLIGGGGLRISDSSVLTLFTFRAPDSSRISLSFQMFICYVLLCCQSLCDHLHTVFWFDEEGPSIFSVCVSLNHENMSQVKDEKDCRDIVTLHNSHVQV